MLECGLWTEGAEEFKSRFVYVEWYRPGSNPSSAHSYEMLDKSLSSIFSFEETEIIMSGLQNCKDQETM